MDDNNTRSIRVMKGSRGIKTKQRYMKLYQRCSDNFKNYLHLYKQSLRLVVREPQSSFCSVNKVKVNEFVRSHHNVGSDVASRGKGDKKKHLTPLPYHSTKRVSSSKEQKDLKLLERNAVVMRMIEYAQRVKPNQHLKSKYINKVESIIYIQKILRGFILRKAFREVLLLYSKLQLFIAHIRNYTVIKAKRVQATKQSTHKISNTRNYACNLRNISPCKTYSSNKSVGKQSNGKLRCNNYVKPVKNINNFLSSKSVNHAHHQQVKPVSKIPGNKVNKTYSNHNKCLRFNKPPKKPIHSSKLRINTTNSNSNSVLANYLNNCASNATEAYTPLNVTTNPTSKSTNRLSKRKYSQHNCASFVVRPTKYVHSIGVQTVITSDDTDNAHSLNVTSVNSVIVNNPFSTYQNNSSLISKRKECLSGKEHVSHVGTKGYNSLRVTQDKSFEIECDAKKHSGMMMSYAVVSKINSIEFEYVPEENINIANTNSTNHKEATLSQFSNEGNTHVVHIKQLPKERSDKSYTKLTLYAAIHDIVASRIILIQRDVRQYLARKNKLALHEEDNSNFICKRNIHLNSCVTKVVKIDLTKRLDVIETAVKRMLCHKGFYNKDYKDPMLLAVTLLIVKRFRFSVKFYIFRLLRRKYCCTALPSESMNTIQDDYDLNEERSKKLNCLFNEVILDLKR